MDAIGLETAAEAYDRAREGRTRAGKQAQEMGVQLPPGIWAVRDETAPSTSRA